MREGASVSERESERERERVCIVMAGCMLMNKIPTVMCIATKIKIIKSHHSKTHTKCQMGEIFTLIMLILNL